MDIEGVEQNCRRSPNESSRLECEVCARPFSSIKRNRLPYVGPCGHTFCKECTRNINGKCAKCRDVFFPAKNYALIEFLEEHKLMKRKSKEKIKNMKETMESMKLKMTEAGVNFDDDNIEVNEESDVEEDDVEEELSEQELLEMQITEIRIPVGELMQLERQVGHPIMEDVWRINERLREYEIRHLQQQQQVRLMQEQMRWLEQHVAQVNLGHDGEPRIEGEE